MTRAATNSAPLQSLAQQWISYAVGIVMEQFQPGEENGLGRGRFDSATVQRLAGLTDRDGLVTLDAGHPDDLAGKALAALDIMLGESAVDELVAAALGTRGERDDRLRNHLADQFFKDHTKKYRKRPIYWLLQSSKKNYALWLYYHRLDKDMLFKALLNYVEPKIRQVSTQYAEGRRQLEQARAAGVTGREIKKLEKQIEKLEDFLSELQDFEGKLRRAADLHLVPDLNDGVVLNIAPLHELVPWKEAKKYWKELMDGKYEWSSIGKQLREKGLVK